ncbi:unnamed protein product, partial [Rotaria magnacalcarata]
MLYVLVACIWCKKNAKKHSVATKKSWRNISSKKFQWIHKLLEDRGSELEAEMIICSKCCTSLYKEKKRRTVQNNISLLDESEETVNVNVYEESYIKLSNVVKMEGFYGDGNDKDYYIWCLKGGNPTQPLSELERISLVCEFKIYCSANARRCKGGCVDIPVERSGESTYLTHDQMIILINDLIHEVNRVKHMPSLDENDSIISEEDYP